MRDNSINFIKIIATSMVLALHLGVARSHYGCGESNIITSVSGIAIPLFFLVSGYLMAGKQGKFSYSLKKFANIIKIPLIICVLFDVVIWARHGFFQFDFPLCFVQKGDWWHFWYFGTMAIIYLFLPFLANIIHSNKLNTVIGILSVVCLVFWIIDIITGFEKNHICQTFRLWYFLMYFLIGSKIKLSSQMLRVSWITTFLLALIYIVSIKYINAGGVEYHFGSPFCILFAVSFFLSALNTDFTKISNSFIWKSAGKAVLPTYIFHVMVLNKITMTVVHPITEGIQVHNFVAFLIEYTFSVIVVYIISILLNSIPLFNRVIKL